MQRWTSILKKKRCLVVDLEDLSILVSENYLRSGSVEVS